MCLFYLHANAKIEIHICSNKPETGLVFHRHVCVMLCYFQCDAQTKRWERCSVTHVVYAVADFSLVLERTCL